MMSHLIPTKDTENQPRKRSIRYKQDSESNCCIKSFLYGRWGAYEQWRPKQFTNLCDAEDLTLQSESKRVVTQFRQVIVLLVVLRVDSFEVVETDFLVRSMNPNLNMQEILRASNHRACHEFHLRPCLDQ